MSGMFESWLHKLVSALQTREEDANVVVVDWLPLAHQLYTDAVNNSRAVGQRLAEMLDWLQVSRGAGSHLSSSGLNPRFLRKCRAHVVTVNFGYDQNLQRYILLN